MYLYVQETFYILCVLYKFWSIGFFVCDVREYVYFSCSKNMCTTMLQF